jgi:hypothetical protein
MTTHKWLLILAALVALLSGCGTKGSGTAATDHRTVDPFTAVEVRGTVELELTVGSTPSVTLSGDDNLLPLVTTDVSGKRLIISSKEGIRPELPLVARVTVSRDLEEIIGRGVTEIRAQGLTGDTLRVELSGAGKADLAGEVGSLELRLSGAGSLDAKRLNAKKIDVDVSGAGRVEVGEPEVLDVDISGAGTVTHRGEPEITQSISGAGSIRKR